MKSYKLRKNTPKLTKIHQNYAKIRQNYAKIRQNYAKIRQNYVKIRQNYAKICQNYAKIRQNYAKIRQNTPKLRKNTPKKGKGPYKNMAKGKRFGAGPRRHRVPHASSGQAQNARPAPQVHICLRKFCIFWGKIWVPSRFAPFQHQIRAPRIEIS